MNREIKFRAWQKSESRMLFDIQNHSTFGKMLNNEHYQIMQFTGLLDKNGKEIFEKSDILSAKMKDFEMRDTIEFGLSMNGFYGLIWSRSKNLVSEMDNISERFEVIGNLYENPKLIKN